MAELATLARPYADALFQVAIKGDLEQVTAEVNALAAIAADAQLRQFADSPTVTAEQVMDVVSAAVETPLSDTAKNLLRTVIANGRLTVLPEIVSQFHVLVNERSGVSDAQVFSAFSIDAEQLEALVITLEKRFGRKLNVTVQVEPALIGGIRVVVGDEVLDTSVKARLEQMKVALAA
ncbi:F0F1 ATP synthase subunit delta [Roseateles sp. GG27B]